MNSNVILPLASLLFFFSSLYISIHLGEKNTQLLSIEVAL